MIQQFNKDRLMRTICAGASDDEVELFIEQCMRTGLDPYSRQINFMMRKARLPNGSLGHKATTMISIDGARLVASRTGHYDGSLTWWCGEDAVWVDVWLGKEHPAAAKTTVHRGTGSYTGVALWREYGEGAAGPMWAKMGAHMLAKCSEMLALRKGFPAELSGLYSSDEMPAEPPSSRFVSDDSGIEVIPAAVRDLGPVSGWSIENMCAWAASTYPHRFNNHDDVKVALRQRGVRSWGPRLDKQAIMQMITLIAAQTSTPSQASNTAVTSDTGTDGGALEQDGT